MLTVFLAIAAANVVYATNDCTTDEFICRGKCTELVRCISAGNDTIIEQVVRKCPGVIAQFCNATARDCEGRSCTDSGIDPAVLSCYEDGVYPHPTRCDRFFTCISGIVKDFICPVNTSYNALYRNCSGTLSARSCVNRPIEACDSVDHIGGYPEDPEVFFMCAYDNNGYLRPQFHRCVSGNVFNKEVSHCVLNSSQIVLASVYLVAVLTWLSVKS